MVARIPDTYGRSLELYGYVWLALLVEQGNLLHLALVKDVGIVSERLVCYLQDTVVGLNSLASVRVDAASDGSEETGRGLVVELEECLQLLSLLAAWYLECRVTANLEVDYLVVGILNVPDNVEFVSGKAIGNGEVEVEWIVLKGLFVVDEGEGKAIAGLADELEIYELAEAVTRQGVLLVTDAVNALPQSANDREEERRLAAPEFLVAIPEIFVTISILDALEFCSVR